MSLNLKEDQKVVIYQYAKSYAHLRGYRLIISKEDLIRDYGDIFGVPRYEVVR
ncbi:hypothetical protein [Escherichia phage pEC-M719-6WT.1]|uniref:Uncharacterized protein n=1 Tax=Escherichia phage pEC-M719-6WT.1 TaxID=3056220 RepID=A0AA51U6C6_9CAUD|nr:hypothetical protein [Escherichia phage pEC-M719-6WT.1]